MSHPDLTLKSGVDVSEFSNGPHALSVEEIRLILITEPIITLLVLLSQMLSTSSTPFSPFFSMTTYFVSQPEACFSAYVLPAICAEPVTSLTCVSWTSGCIFLKQSFVCVSFSCNKRSSVIICFLPLWHRYRNDTCKQATLM